MKKLLSLSIILVFMASSIVFAQEQSRTVTFGVEKYRSYIENYVHTNQVTDNGQEVGALIFAENFDNTGGQLPFGWTKGGDGSTCQWNVDATPATPGYYSASYSLNYNNGTDFACNRTWGWVRSPLINTGGASLDISFWFNVENECGGGGYCFFDQTWLFVEDENLNILASFRIDGYPLWNQFNYQFYNANGVKKVYFEFYFDTYDGIGNVYYGPFIDDIEIHLKKVIPVSTWALAIGITLIVAFTFIRYRRMS